MQDWKIVNSSKYSLSCCTYVFHRCRFVLAFSALAFSTLAYSYLRIPYLHIPSSGTFVFRTCVFSRPKYNIHTMHGSEFDTKWWTRGWKRAHKKTEKWSLDIFVYFCISHISLFPTSRWYIVLLHNVIGISVQCFHIVTSALLILILTCTRAL